MNNNILNQIKDIRIKKGISIKELSDKTKMSYNYLLLLENGKKNNPSLKTFTKIAKALNVEIALIYKA